MKLYTIGFTKKTAKCFFEVLKKNKIDELVDVRLNNKSQLAGFAKGKDLEYFLDIICGIKYCYEESFAPTKTLLDDWKKGIISWDVYEKRYKELLEKRLALNTFKKKYTNKKNICFLCSEATVEHCHRRLLAEYIVENCEPIVDNEIIHL